MWHNNFTVRKFSGVLHTLLPKAFFIQYLINQTIRKYFSKTMSMAMAAWDDAPFAAEIADVVDLVFSYLFIF